MISLTRIQQQFFSTFFIYRLCRSIHQRHHPSTSPSLSIKALNDYGQYDRAFHLFDQQVKQEKINIISLLNIVDTCTRSENLQRAHQIEQLINQSRQWKDNIRLQTSLINMYMKCHKIDRGKSMH